MPDVLLALLRLIFLGFIFLFVWQVARAIGTHLGINVRRRARRRGSRVAIVRSSSQAGLGFDVRYAVVLGRSEEADIVLEDPYASDFHLRFVASEDGLTLHDLGSTNGTYVNGRRVTTPRELSRGDSVQVGKTVMEVR
ncbi:MAG: FHA domain-containing protein [Acidimicrobiia bacterium]|nr:FHA domain-containing protein [Acidimicrobiia bacterium]